MLKIVQHPPYRTMIVQNRHQYIAGSTDFHIGGSTHILVAQPDHIDGWLQQDVRTYGSNDYFGVAPRCSVASYGKLC